MPALRPAAGPVSYTHLDVYKRQGLDLLSVSIGFTIKETDIPWGVGFLSHITKRVRDETGLATTSAWGFGTPEAAQAAVQDEHLDIVMVGRSHPVSYTHLCQLSGSVCLFSRYRLGQHRLQQPGEAGFQIGLAQGVLVNGAFRAGMHQTGVAQDAEVMRHAGFGPACVQFAAGSHPDTGPVSYTHLDVYKRQHQHHPRATQFVVVVQPATGEVADHADDRQRQAHRHQGDERANARRRQRREDRDRMDVAFIQHAQNDCLLYTSRCV